MSSKVKNMLQIIAIQCFFVINISCLGAEHASDYQQKLEQLIEHNASIDQNVKNLNPSNKKVIEALLSSAKLHNNGDSIITDNEWQELECDALIEKLNRSQTSFGLWGLKQISNPISDRLLIENRQKKIKALVHNKDKFEKFKQLLQTIKDTENDLVSFWCEHDSLQVATSDLYYSLLPPYSQGIDNFLNHNKLILESTMGYQIAKRVMAFASSLCITGAMLEASNALLYKTNFSLKRAVINGLKRPVTMNNPFPNVYKEGYDAQSNEKWSEFVTSGNAGDTYQFFKGKGFHSSLAFSLTLMIVAHMDIMTALDIRDNWRSFMAIARTTTLLHVRMNRIARLFKAIVALHDMIANDPDLYDPQLMQLLSIHAENKHIKQLIKLLSATTFDDQQSYFYSRGNVLLAHQLMHDYKNELIPLLQGIALIDAHYSIASLYTQQQNDKKKSFCFVQFNDSKHPYIMLNNFWTPLMPTQHVVLNTIDWENQRNKIILTGPNGSGKSTIMKSIAHAIILAQSWGIVPAAHASLSVFTGLRTSLSPRENLQDNLSTFMAEKQRMDVIHGFIKNGKANDRYFVLLDEPYRGTVASEAEQRIALFGKEIASAEHCMLMMATHLEKPVDLEKETDTFANYQLDLEEQGAQFIRTFKLIPGAAVWWFNDKERRMRFIDQLIKPV